MTMLTHLNIHHLRNIHTASISPHPRYNLIYGLNGSGKTSFLEAIYLLSRAHSFRSREVSPLVSHQQSELTVFAKTSLGDQISIQKSKSGSTRVKLNQQICQRSSELAHFLPCQLFYQGLFQLIDAGPGIRRNLLDWGMFHVKHAYHLLWKQYQHVLLQRNALLRQRADRQQFKPWDMRLVELSQQIHVLRQDYFDAWSGVYQLFLAQLTDVACTIQYDKGWDRKDSGKSLESILAEQFEQDCQRQYTQSGPHQADILFDTTTLKAKKVLSRGQQKIILIALKFAQAFLLKKPCLYLLDDITAELDSDHIRRVIQSLSQLEGQFFLTAIDVEQLTKFSEFQAIGLFNLVDGVVTGSNDNLNDKTTK